MCGDWWWRPNFYWKLLHHSLLFSVSLSLYNSLNDCQIETYPLQKQNKNHIYKRLVILGIFYTLFVTCFVEYARLFISHLDKTISVHSNLIFFVFIFIYHHRVCNCACSLYCCTYIRGCESAVRQQTNKSKSNIYNLNETLPSKREISIAQACEFAHKI